MSTHGRTAGDEGGAGRSVEGGGGPRARATLALALLAFAAPSATAGDLPLRPPAVPGPTRAAPPAAFPKPPAAAPSRAPRERVAYDEPGDGTLWARGETYKAGFSREGTVYAPFLGSRAPRNFPVTFRVASASVGGTPIAFDAGAAPALAGDTVRYARGGFDELWELGLGSAEQRFLFEQLPGAGEIVLRVAAQTELAAREVEEGFRFENELGGVRYGRATAVDARGSSVAAPTTLTDGGIEIRVPAGFVARARPPLVVDPVVSTFTVDNSPIDSFYPDVAYDAALDRWLVAYEEIFSAVDRDIHYKLLTALGSQLAHNYAELSITQNWTNPAVAYNRRLQNFLIVAETGFAPNRVIQGRLVTNTGMPSGPPIVLSVGDQGGDKLNPDVGGDPRPSGNTLYCVVWERVFSAGDRDVHYRMLSPEGFLQGTSTLHVDNSGSTLDRAPSISKSNGGEEWNLAWQRDGGVLRGARIGNAGSIAAAAWSIATGGNPALASASSSLEGTDRWIVAYEYDNSSDTDIGVVALDGATPFPYLLDLSGYEHVSGTYSTWFLEQGRPAVDTDGETFTVAYAELFPGSVDDWDVFVTTLAPTGTTLALAEFHRNLAHSSTVEDFPSIASRAGSGGPLPRHLAVWHDVVVPSAHTDIEAGLYDAPLFAPFCIPGLVWSIACPCGNGSGANDRGCDNSADTGGGKLAAGGAPSLAADTALLTAQDLLPTALSVFNQGDAVLASSVPFGQGVRCVGGSLKRLYTKTAAGGVASAPTGGDPSISARSAALGDPITAGSTRAYYVYYRDPDVLGGCPASATFNATQAIQAVWVP